MTNFSIKDLADFSGIKPHTIRMWEQRFTFLKPRRAESLRRFYSTEELNTFLGVTLLNHSGYRVSKIARMTPEEKTKEVAKLSRVQQDLRDINELIICMAEMDMEGFELILNKAITEQGIHATIAQILIPFAERVGLFHKIEGKTYLENMILIKDIVKRKIHVGIETAGSFTKQDQTILFFQPPGEQQELSLIYMNYLMKMAGFKIIYLGRHITTDTLEAVTGYIKPNYIITHLLEKHSRHDLGRYIDQLAKNQPDTQFITLGNPLSLPGRVKGYKHASGVIDVMDIVLKKEFRTAPSPKTNAV